MAKKPSLPQISWPVERLGELLEILARKSRLTSQPKNISQPPDSLLESGDAQALSQWVDNAAGYLELEAEPISVQYADLSLLLRSGGPAVLQIAGTSPEGANSSRINAAFLALVSANRNKTRLLCPDLKVRTVESSYVENLISIPLESGLGAMVDEVLNDAQIPPEFVANARRAILRDQLGPVRIDAGWILRLPAGVKLANQFREQNLYRPIWIMLGMYFIQQLLSIASWYVIGRGIFQGHFEFGWILGWAILLLFTIPVAMIVSDAQSELSISAGAVFKQRLLQGTLKLEPEEIRHQGLGQFLDRVMQSEAVELLALSGGFVSILSFVELGLALVILTRVPDSLMIALSLVVWIFITLYLLWRYARQSQVWANAYREMTNDLVESMVGHRTRLIQEDQNHWHDKEDQTLENYLRLSENLDRVGMQIAAVVSRGWIIVGLSGLALIFVTANPAPQTLAIGLGGVLFAAQGLGKLTGGAQSLSSLSVAWQQVGPLFDAASRKRQLPDLNYVPPVRGVGPGSENVQLATVQSVKQQPLMMARDLSFRYRPTGRPVLDGCTLQVYPGDRILLEGPSGGGKTSLGSVLTGLRQPESGSLLLWGYDSKILGNEEWRRRVVMAPQFQENHVFSETFAFNLLLGRRWPPLQEDLAEAEIICEELGLGDLLKRMPSGFQQMLGESGWQLSHGERSRLFIARALLQQSDLIILDESFGALDPENLSRAMQCVLDRASSVIVIAHP
ncbi:MAG: hypothetical protein B6D39_11975 [Anaerolineae bacterium UTCFX2]|jgi:ATP-binding cassette subfamily B protein|nr:ABC transporter ATP-binding protein [Anaerolineae bacterium]MCZ7554251.1 ABC transporter ATP-binding protein/permease [Anaerolineales bacterium]OQY87923.1 MAG: hypothetical protein B6D39_11975 [Anaerolineae bacterium UTCFX2]